MAVRVPLPLVTAGMRLARPLVDPDGLPVAGAGTQLGPSVLRVLRRMAVQSVLVEEADGIPSWACHFLSNWRAGSIFSRYSGEPW